MNDPLAVLATRLPWKQIEETVATGRCIYADRRIDSPQTYSTALDLAIRYQHHVLVMGNSFSAG